MLCFLDFTAFLNFKNPLSSYLFCIRMIRVSQCNKQSKKRSGFVPEAVFLSHVAGVMNLVCFEMCFSFVISKYVGHGQRERVVPCSVHRFGLLLSCELVFYPF